MDILTSRLVGFFLRLVGGRERDINFLKTPEGRTTWLSRVAAEAAAGGNDRTTSRGDARRGPRERRDEVLRTGRAPLVSLPGSLVY